MVEVTCANCGLQILVPPTVQGRTGICFSCGKPVTVPSAIPGVSPSGGFSTPASGNPPGVRPSSSSGNPPGVRPSSGSAGPSSTPSSPTPQPPAHTSPSPVDEEGDILYQEGDRVAGRYTVHKQLGKGGMGTVYKANDMLVNEDVALKFMKASLLTTDRARQMFLQEVQITRKLRHENIISVHDVNFAPDGNLYISMEFLKGESLRDTLRKQRHERKFLDIRFAVRVVEQMLSGLEYAHKYVIHRDIKPENVMLLSNERVKLLDFGLAAAAKPPKDAPKQQSKHMLGTVAYASPEQRMLQPLDPRTDLYAVGLVLRELLTLRAPTEEPWNIEQCRREVAPQLLKVVYKALETDRDARWPDAKTFRHALREAYDTAYKPIASQGVQNVRADASTEGMVFLHGGRFLMGNSAIREEAPEDEVHVGPFWMDRHPVTVKQYAAFLKATGTPPPLFWGDGDFGGDDQPVVGVNWTDALAYAQWAGKALPNEMQWEYAARGQENRRFPWPEKVPPDRNLCNYDNYLGMPSMVAMHEEGATPDGILDLAGNVWEWTIDPFAPYDMIRKDPAKANTAPMRVVRGGCWESKSFELTTTFRKGLFPDSRFKTLGFRCVIPVNEGG